MTTRTPEAVFKSGDRVNEVLTGAGSTTTEASVVLYVRRGIAYVDQGPGNDPTRYDASTGKYDGGDVLGFSRRIATRLAAPQVPLGAIARGPS